MARIQLGPTAAAYGVAAMGTELLREIVHALLVKLVISAKSAATWFRPVVIRVQTVGATGDLASFFLARSIGKDQGKLT
jgi:hypothetical protein